MRELARLVSRNLGFKCCQSLPSPALTFFPRPERRGDFTQPLVCTQPESRKLHCIVYLYRYWSVTGARATCIGWKHCVVGVTHFRSLHAFSSILALFCGLPCDASVATAMIFEGISISSAFSSLSFIPLHSFFILHKTAGSPFSY